MLTMFDGNLTLNTSLQFDSNDVKAKEHLVTVCLDNRDTLLSNASSHFHFFLRFTDVPLMWSGYFCELLENFTHTLMVPMNTKYLFQRAVANKQYF